MYLDAPVKQVHLRAPVRQDLLLELIVDVVRDRDHPIRLRVEVAVPEAHRRLIPVDRVEEQHVLLRVEVEVDALGRI